MCALQNMATSSSSTKLTLKLLVDTKNEKVLFTETSKPVVDFLFNFLTLPIGTVVKLIGSNNMVGSIGNLYQSVENLSNNYMLPNQAKDVLLNPSFSLKTLSRTSAFILKDELENEDQEEDEDYNEDYEDEDEEEDEIEEDEYEEEDDNEDSLGGMTLFYRCPNECSYDVTCDKTTLCSSCKRAMTNQINYVRKKYDEEFISIQNAGFVKNDMIFLVMDDLAIQPMPALSGVTILNKFNIKEFGTLKEMVVELGVDEGMKLLKASLRSRMVLTNVFLKKEY